LSKRRAGGRADGWAGDGTDHGGEAEKGRRPTQRKREREVKTMEKESEKKEEEREGQREREREREREKEKEREREERVKTWSTARQNCITNRLRRRSDTN
jgi:hypothetical protein